MAAVALLSVEVVLERPIKSGVIFLRGGESLRHLSDGPFEPDPDSTGVGIGRKERMIQSLSFIQYRSIFPISGSL